MYTHLHVYVSIYVYIYTHIYIYVYYILPTYYNHAILVILVRIWHFFGTTSISLLRFDLDDVTVTF